MNSPNWKNLSHASPSQLKGELTKVRAQLERRSFKHFLKNHWRTIETNEFVDNWHIDAICDHLEAVTTGQIRRLIINIPPRHSKSTACSVFWPAWSWIDRPGLQWMFASYAQTLSVRDSVKCRRVVNSRKYKEMLATLKESESDAFEDWRLTDDQATKIRFENTKGGYRLSTSVSGGLTGEGGDIVVIDDPHNVIEGESEVKRQEVLTWWDESMQTRLNNPKTGAFVIIMQRVHETDLCGHILAREAKNWNHLCLPARYEGFDRSRTILKFKDPRKTMNEPLNAGRFGEIELRNLEKSMTAYAAAGQLQQRPAPRDGGMHKVDRMKQIARPMLKDIRRAVRYWDKAASDQTGAYTAGTLILFMTDGSFCIANVVRGQWAVGEREDVIYNTALSDYRWLREKYRIYVEQEPGSGGKESAQATIARLAGFTVYADKVTGDKVTRAEPLAAQIENRNVTYVEGEWNEAFKAELRMFPNGKYRDQADSASGAFNKLTAKIKRAGAAGGGNARPDPLNERKPYNAVSVTKS